MVGRLRGAESLMGIYQHPQNKTEAASVVGRIGLDKLTGKIIEVRFDTKNE